VDDEAFPNHANAQENHGAKKQGMEQAHEKALTVEQVAVLSLRLAIKDE
jgi:hypothetical protein